MPGLMEPGAVVLKALEEVLGRLQGLDLGPLRVLTLEPAEVERFGAVSEPRKQAARQWAPAESSESLPGPALNQGMDLFDSAWFRLRLQQEAQ